MATDTAGRVRVLWRVRTLRRPDMASAQQFGSTAESCTYLSAAPDFGECFCKALVFELGGQVQDWFEFEFSRDMHCKTPSSVIINEGDAGAGVWLAQVEMVCSKDPKFALCQAMALAEDQHGLFWAFLDADVAEFKKDCGGGGGPAAPSAPSAPSSSPSSPSSTFAAVAQKQRDSAIRFDNLSTLNAMDAKAFLGEMKDIILLGVHDEPGGCLSDFNTRIIDDIVLTSLQLTATLAPDKYALLSQVRDEMSRGPICLTAAQLDALFQRLQTQAETQVQGVVATPTPASAPGTDAGTPQTKKRQRVADAESVVPVPEVQEPLPPLPYLLTTQMVSFGPAADGDPPAYTVLSIDQNFEHWLRSKWMHDAKFIMEFVEDGTLDAGVSVLLQCLHQFLVELCRQGCGRERELLSPSIGTFHFGEGELVINCALPPGASSTSGATISKARIALQKAADAVEAADVFYFLRAFARANHKAATSVTDPSDPGAGASTATTSYRGQTHLLTSSLLCLSYGEY
jgi:hypothetical protein